jgi:hypothetical protein
MRYHAHRMQGLLACLLVVACAARSAAAEGERRGVGVLVVAEPQLKKQVDAHVRRWLRANGKRIAAALSASAATTLGDCFLVDDQACARGVFEARTRTRSLVFVRAEASAVGVSIEMFAFVKDQPPTGARRSCAPCSPDSWRPLADDILTQLAPSLPTEAPFDEDPPPSRLGPALLLGAGVVTLVTGGVLLYYGLRDDAAHKYIYPDATAPGIVLCAVGAGAAIGGTVLLISAGRTESGPVASVGPGHGYVGWVGRF